MQKPASVADSGLEPGSVTGGVYQNKTLGISCKIPAGWVLRTEEMNAREEDEPEVGENKTDVKDGAAQPAEEKSQAALDRTARSGCDHMCSTVLLAAFSRPPEAAGADVNSSILIAAESVTAYPGLKEAAQYFGPVTEVAKGQGFAVVNEPYEFLVGSKTVVRGDFRKDVGSRVMRQSTLVLLERGYAVSFTFLSGTEEELEELIGGLSFGTGSGPARK